MVTFGQLTPVPRWSEAYGRSYYFSGTAQRAQQIPQILTPLLEWGRAHVDERYNGILVKWYDGARQQHRRPSC